MTGRPGRRQSLRRQQRVLQQSENQRRRHSMTDQAPHHNEENVLLDFRGTRLGEEEAKMDIDEEKMQEEEKLIESLDGIESKHKSLVNGAHLIEMSSDANILSGLGVDDSTETEAAGGGNDALGNDGEDGVALEMFRNQFELK